MNTVRDAKAYQEQKSVLTASQRLRLVAGVICIAAFAIFPSACSHLPTRKPASEASICKGIDWWEVGRSDGVLGSLPTKIRDHEIRCGSGMRRNEIENYMNGREAGLVDYCTPATGFAAGKNGLGYEGVCPQHLAEGFIGNYENGKRVRDLEQETVDLEDRIEKLVQKVMQDQSASHPLDHQIDHLRRRQAEIDHEIDRLESESM